jgi:SET domain-containing protein
MLTVPVEIKKSPIHGYGVFALHGIRRGSVVWMYHPGLDRRVTKFQLKFCEGRIKEFILQRGYINPKSPEEYVICVDEAQFINFPPPDKPANLQLGGVLDNEHILLAAVDILAGEELTVPPESDADYATKMKGYGSG